MDTQTAEQRNVEADIAVIKAKMPDVYRAIQQRAETVPDTYKLVRRGLRGEANCFYAFQAGYVMGTPFAGHSIEADVAVQMVTFGVSAAWIFPVEGMPDGAH